MPTAAELVAACGDGDVAMDVLVLAVSIPSFEQTLRGIAPILARRSGDLLVCDVLSVKEHPRQLLLELCPPQVRGVTDD